MHDRRAHAVPHAVSHAALVALTVAVALAVSACGGSKSSSDPDIASRSPNQIVDSATTAIEGVHSVRVSGSVAGAGSHPITLDLRLVAGKGATGSLSENGLSFRLITIGRRAYINGSSGFWRQFAGPSAASRLQGRWLRAPADSGEFRSFQSLTDLHSLLSQLLSGHGALTKGDRAQVRGRSAIALRDSDRNGTLYVAATGTPYPLRLVNAASSGGRLDFSDFDAPVDLAAPASSIDISTLHR